MSRSSIILIYLLVLCLAAFGLEAQIAVYGDTQGNEEIHSRIVKGILSRQPKIAFHTGDLTSNGSKEKNWDRFFALSGPLLDYCPFYPARGNHEKTGNNLLARFPHLRDRLYYTVLHDSLLFIVLDSNQDLMPRSEQYNWLEQTLTENPDRPKIVLMHHPVFSSGWHGGEEGFDLILPDLFAGRSVIAVLAGHDHNYERLEYGQINYIVCGGGGGKQRSTFNQSPYSKIFFNEYSYLILDRSGPTLCVTAYDLEGAVLDQINLSLR